MILVKWLNHEETVVIISKGENIVAKASFQGKTAQMNADMFAYYYGKENGRSNDIVYEGA